MPECQSGFRKKFSTTTCLVKLVNDIRVNMEDKKITCLALLDFSKAFDTINYDMLLAKLHYFGLSENSITFFKNYLSNRLHCVQVRQGNHQLKSNYVSMTCGIPQGSILGPLLFSLYVADMNKEIEFSTLQQYADDSQIYCAFASDNLKQAEENFKTDINNIYKYSMEHNLKLNASKSCIMLLGNNQTILNYLSDNLDICVNNTKIPIVKDARNLGIYFDSNLKFDIHVKNKLKIAYMRLKGLVYFKKHLPQNTKYYLCNSLILSLFDYGDVVYGSSLTQIVARSIQKLQNSCMRFSYNISFRTHITPYLNQFNILSMVNRRKLHMLTFIYRILQTGQPPYLKSLFIPFDHTHVTRNLHRFRIPQHRTAGFQKSFSFLAPQLWNSLPISVKCFKSHYFNKYVKNNLLVLQSNII